jgi:hypothetical protein
VTHAMLKPAGRAAQESGPDLVHANLRVNIPKFVHVMPGQSDSASPAFGHEVSIGAVQCPFVASSSEYPAFRRDHWAVGRPSLRVKFLPLSQPLGASSHASCRP